MNLHDNTIDIVLPYVNPMDPAWQSDFNKYKQQSGDKGKNRFRDAGTLKYWFKLVRKNSKFKYRIVLILAKKSQRPQWLKPAKDLLVVYHDEFIPKSELPTFNSSVINCYIPFIKDLHERYILFNDDVFMMRPTYEEDWFDGNTPKLHSDWVKYPRCMKVWDKNIGNCQMIINHLMKSDVYYVPEHGPLSHRRSVDLFLWSRIRSLMTESLSNSRFRTDKNVTDWIFSMFYVVGSFGISIPHPISTYYNNEIISIPTTTKLACYNDTELIQDYEKYSNKLHSILKEVVDA